MTELKAIFFDLNDLKLLKFERDSNEFEPKSASMFSKLAKFIVNKPYSLGDKRKINIRPISSCKPEASSSVIIAFANMKDLHNPETYTKLIKSKWRKISNSQDEDFNDYAPCPMIVIGIEDLQCVIEYNIQHPYCDNDKERYQKNLQIVKSLNLDPKVAFLDSSIWHYYVPLNEKFIEQFTDTIKEIVKNFSLDLYKINVAKEFLEFQSRLLHNSFLAKVGGPHAKAIAPFKFYFSSELKYKSKEFEKNLKKTGCRWRLLVLDDYAAEMLKIGEKKDGKTKLEIIRKVLKLEEHDDWIELEAVERIGNSFIEGFKNLFRPLNSNNDKGDPDKAKSKKIYDIILVDYLLSSKDESISKREYCTELFQWIKKNEYDNNLQGPLGKFWFFPISVFSYAFMEELHQLGYKHLEEEWHIARGADPVNTPELFRYSLFKFMEMQINEARSFRTILELIEKVFPYKEIWDYTDNPKIIQSLAKKNYHIFLREMNSFEMLVYDKKNKSLFAESFSKKYKDIDNSLWGHLHHLIFMLGNESASEWAKMWDELNIIEDRLIQIEALSEHEGYYLEPIKNYIINLQKQVR